MTTRRARRPRRRSSTRLVPGVEEGSSSSARTAPARRRSTRRRCEMRAPARRARARRAWSARRLATFAGAAVHEHRERAERAAAGPKRQGSCERPPSSPRRRRRRRAKGRGRRATPRRGGPQLRLERRRSRSASATEPRWRDGAPSSEHRSTKGTPGAERRATKRCRRRTSAARPPHLRRRVDLDQLRSEPTLHPARARAARRRSAFHTRGSIGAWKQRASSATPDPASNATPQRRGRRPSTAPATARAGRRRSPRARVSPPWPRRCGRRETPRPEHREEGGQSPRRDASHRPRRSSQ